MPSVSGVPFTSHLHEGDVVAVHPSGLVETLFRVGSENNALFVTDRCNSNCLMCSQPPRDVDDIDRRHNLNTQLVPFIPKETEFVGITGGEPTLLGNRLLGLLEQLKEELPTTDIHALTNGRAFAWKHVAAAVAGVGHNALMLGIPLYSDYAPHHDYVVQAKDAFAQTVLGLHNLGRYGVRVEIRVVLHKQTYRRLPQLAEFIYRTFPFAAHVALMGLEYTGYTPHNGELLWIEPSEYVGELEEATEMFSSHGMRVSIYNHPLCLLPRTLWTYCRKSISDWKREYLPECARCSVVDACGGVFATSKQVSEQIRAVVK